MKILIKFEKRILRNDMVQFFMDRIDAFDTLQIHITRLHVFSFSHFTSGTAHARERGWGAIWYSWERDACISVLSTDACLVVQQLPNFSVSTDSRACIGPILSLALNINQVSIILHERESILTPSYKNNKKKNILLVVYMETGENETFFFCFLLFL